MGIKSLLSKPLSDLTQNQINQWKDNPFGAQKYVFHKLIEKAKNTQFGKDHHFEDIKNYDDFKKNVPIRDYESLKPYIDRIIAGEKNVLWPGIPLYFCKTSGTTSGTKYIPISNVSIGCQIEAAKNALLSYISETRKADFVDGKMIFLQGSPLLDQQGAIPTGRLSGIVAHHVPVYLQKNRMPSFETNCIEDWEAKVDAIVEETYQQDMRLISGIPPWVQMYFEKLIEKTGKKTIREIFPNFSLFVYGGVNFEPYRSIFDRLVGDHVDSIELFPASEGFIAFQDSQKEPGMLLLLNSGIFYEFVSADEIHHEKPNRINLEDVELNKNYAIILNTNAGLWGYNIGDTVKFVSKSPYRIIVTGRIKHFTSAFGEHVIAEEVEYALKETLKTIPAEIVDFHVAPQVNPPAAELPYHEWLIEFSKEPENMEKFKNTIDHFLQSKNTYYKDLVQGNILQPLKIRTLPRNAFLEYMKSEGKLGGQNKPPRLANDRKMAALLTNNNKK